MGVREEKVNNLFRGNGFTAAVVPVDPALEAARARALQQTDQNAADFDVLMAEINGEDNSGDQNAASIKPASLSPSSI